MKKSNYQIIIQQYNLSKKEYKQIYNNLIKNPIVKIDFNLTHIDKVINRLKFLSKSAKVNVKYCQKRFQYGRILRPELEEKQTTYFNVYGGNVHMVYDKVWNKLNINKLLNLSQKLLIFYIYNECMNFVPEYEKKLDIYTSLFKFYAEFETYRITEIINEMGKDKSEKYILPKFKELELENHEMFEAGKIDVMHLLTNDELAIVDYKTGNPKYYNLNTYHKQAIDYELGSYMNLLESKDNEIYQTTEIINEGKKIKILIPFKNIYPTKGMVLYLRDWKNTFKYVTLVKDMQREANNLKYNVIVCINKGEFKASPSNNCFNFCPYINYCLKDTVWKNKWASIYPTTRKKLEVAFQE